MRMHIVKETWLTYAWMLYRLKRPMTGVRVGWFDDELWKECCEAAKRGTDDDNE